jgi:hypothetical protein
VIPSVEGRVLHKQIAHAKAIETLVL